MAHSAISMINVNRKTAANLDKLRGLQECDGKNKPDSKSGFMQFHPTQLFSTSAIICTLLFSVASIPAQAGKIYRWTDENGQMHFSENPPRGIETETVKIKASSGGAAATSSTTSASNVKASGKKEQAKEQLTSDYTDEEKAQYCQQSRTLLSQMEGNANRRFKQEDGSYQRLDDQQRADYIAEAKDGIERFCQ